MSIASQISRLQSAKASLKTAIENKGVTVPSSALIDTYDDYVAEISGGGGGGTCYFETDNPYTSTTFGYKSIKNITIPSGVTSIDDSAFSGCTGMTSVVIPNGVTRIGSYAFLDTRISSMTIPNTVTYIGSQIIWNINKGNSPLKRINSDTDGVANLPDSLSNVGDRLLIMAKNITSVHIPTNASTIDNQFAQDSNITSLVIPSGVTRIGSSAFARCSGLTSVDIQTNNPNVLSGEGIFSGCTSLTEVTVREGVTSIGASAFYQCSGLTSIYLPSTITLINYNALKGCNSLTSITISATTPPTIYKNSWNWSLNENNCPIYVPSGSVDTYKAANVWSEYADRIQAIPSPSSQQWISVSADNNIPSGTIYDLRISSATTIEEDYIITIDTDDASVMIGNLCSGEECTEYNCEEYECTEYDEETGECIEQGENCIQQGDECVYSECTAHTKAFAWSDDNYNIGYDEESITPLTFDSDGYWYLNAATGMSGFESDGGNTAPFDLQVLMIV